MRKPKHEIVRRAQQGEKDAAIELLTGALLQLQRGKPLKRPISEEVREYLVFALADILDGAPPDAALCLSTGYGGNPRISQQAEAWRRMMIVKGVDELVRNKTAKDKKTAFLYMEEHWRFPDLYDSRNEDEQIGWERIRDLYYRHRPKSKR